MLRNVIYYTLKPYIPARLRRAMRRRVALRIRRHSGHVWPILPGSETPPTGWQGWPDGRRFAFVLSHDVEGRLGLERVKQLASLEMEHGFRSSFNFVPEGSYAVPARLRTWLTDRGFEVGVHDLHHDGRLYRSRKSFQRKAVRINRYLQEWNACGFRSGFMLHNLDWLRDLNVAYDASTFDTDPFEPQPDGAGTIFPFLVPGRNPGADSGYVELPYTLVQDSTLFLLLRETGTDIWRTKLDWIIRHGGMALLNTHPDYMAFNGTSGPAEFDAGLYASFLRDVRLRHGNEYWHALPRDVAAHFRATLASAERESTAQAEPSATAA